jgi:putative oxidoreductase
MNTAERIHNLEHWGETHHPAWLDIIRIALGVFFIIKAVQFLNNMSQFITDVGGTFAFNSFALVMIAHLVVFVHLVGGLFIALGMFTRIGCIMQIPILIGALIFLANNRTALEPYSQWIITVVALLLSIFFLIEGNGPWSVERFLDEKPKAPRTPQHST